MPVALEVLAALAPSGGVGLIFWYAMRAIIRADRRERMALAQLEADETKTHGPTD